MLAVFVLFTSGTEFLIIAMYMGGVPLAEHDSVVPWITITTGVDDVTTFGGTNKITIQVTILYKLYNTNEPLHLRCTKFKSIKCSCKTTY